MFVYQDIVDAVDPSRNDQKKGIQKSYIADPCSTAITTDLPHVDPIHYAPIKTICHIPNLKIVPKKSLPVKKATEKEPAAPAVDPPSDMAAEITPATQDDGVAPTVAPIADVEMCL
ncbi:hypothetical protein BASA50_007787 [Batrachochytrium salamandrivorans]|uniref:Uncharacterized protein n=1 Tax=Batrachochytrium salamandrivorans TaxID=1357716 RepID=A0ABQ8F624_9FUNG|nr:hypothetical protein BASA50_007787 [Batrachochytrium salamandrivorans]